MLPHIKLLRLWDSIWVEGSEVILRYCLAIFFLMERDLLKMESSLDFYTMITQLPSLLQDSDCPLFPGHSILQLSFSLSPFPFPGVRHLRKKLRDLNAREIAAKGLNLKEKRILRSWDDLSGALDSEELSSIRESPERQTGFVNMGNAKADEDEPNSTDLLDFDPNAQDSGSKSLDLLSNQQGYSMEDLSTEAQGNQVKGEYDLVMEKDYADFVETKPAQKNSRKKKNKQRRSETPYERLKAGSHLIDADRDPQIKRFANNLSLEIMEGVINRYQLWLAEDATVEEQNDLILAIIETSPGVVSSEGEVEVKRNIDRRPRAKSTEWVSKISKMIGINSETDSNQRSTSINNSNPSTKKSFVMKFKVGLN